jgi:hypothetical protein
MRPLRLFTIGISTLVASVTVTLVLLRNPPIPTRDFETNAPTRLPQELPSEANRCEIKRKAFRNRLPVSESSFKEKTRAEILARARAEPVVFFEAPEDTALPPKLQELRRLLFDSLAPGRALHETFSALKGQPKQLRQVILTDGYLYADSPSLATKLASIPLTRLFDESELEVTRGDALLRAKRKGRDYIWADGPEAGQPARMWLFDRITVHGESFSPQKHVTVSALRRQTAADRIELENVNPEGALATLVYGTQRVPALLSIQNGRLSLECTVVPKDLAAVVDTARDVNQRRERVLERLRAVISEQVEEALPFDEPITEEGQQDGQLRMNWRLAYAKGEHTFEFNGDEYPVFNATGLPRTPQVCVDFITDTWERLSGTRYTRREEGRNRKVGRLDLDATGIENRRRVQSLIDFATTHSEWFDAKVIPEAERVRFANRTEFFGNLYEQRAHFQPGDVVAILGPRDDGKQHYHSFFIFESDPLTGMPTLVAANAGRPRIRTWESEMRNAPLRSIVARIRPRIEWLEAIAGTEKEALPILASL